MNPTRSTRTYDGKITASRFDRNPGLVGGSVIRGGTAAPPATEKSRLSFPQQGETILPSEGKAVAPITWVDGTPYDEGTLNQQIIYEVDALPHKIFTFPGPEFTVPDAGVWTPIPGFTWTLEAGTWVIIACILNWGIAGYHYNAMDTPVGTLVAGETIHQNSNPVPEVGNWNTNASSEFLGDGWYQNSETVAQGAPRAETHDLVIVTGGGIFTWYMYGSTTDAVKCMTGSSIIGARI
jgi:hypothetical protein